MITPADLVLTDKMLAEVAKLHPYIDTCMWTCYGEIQEDDCWRCDQCEEMLVLGLCEPSEEQLAQHLVFHHSFTYDGLTPTELADLCAD